MEPNQTNQPESKAPELKKEVEKTAAPSREEDIKKNKDIAGLSYVPPISIFVYLFKKDSPFIRENAKQGVVLFMILILGWLIGMIPGIGFIGWILLVVAFIFIVLGFLKAFNDGETLKIPILTAYLSKHEFSDIMGSTKSKLEEKTQEATDLTKTDAINKAQETVPVEEKKEEVIEKKKEENVEKVVEEKKEEAPTEEKKES
jgi:uncharacterized membrane protein